MIKAIYKQVVSEKQRIVLRQGFLKAVAPFYYGSNFYCIFCDQSFRKFLSKGNTLIERPHAVCPQCGSLERTRLLMYYLQNETALFKENLKVLHFAPEKCLFDRLKPLNIDYIDCDINPALASNKVDIMDIPFPDKHFDLIICAHVLGHVPDEKKAIDEVYRVLKINGRAIIMTLLSDQEKTIEDQTVTSDEGRLQLYGEHDLLRLHGQDFTNRLQRSHVKVHRIDYRNHFSQEDQKKYSLGNGQREIVFDCQHIH